MIKRIVTTLTLAALLGPASLAAAPSVQAQSTIIAPVLPVEQTSPPNPLTASRFSVVVNGTEVAAFNELVSLESEIDPGASAGATRGPAAQPSSTTLLPHVTLKRGMTGGMEIWSWHQAAVAGPLDGARKAVTLAMYNTEGAPVARFLLARAWPASVEVTALKAGASEILQETVTFVCDNIRRASPS